MNTNIEYRIYAGKDFDNADVDHLTFRECKTLLKNPTSDILLIEKVKRFWEVDGTLVNEEIVSVLYEKQINNNQ